MTGSIRRINCSLTLVLLITSIPTTNAVAQGVPDLDPSFAVTVATEPVALYTVPDGSGHSFTQAQTFGGLPETDATVTVTILNQWEEPIANWPHEDVWLESALSGLTLVCPGGTIADFNTNEYGQTFFISPLFAGGCNAPPDDTLIVMISGMPLNQPGLDIFINSPDINGDGLVSLTDVSLFAQAYMDQSDPPFFANYWWDDDLNLTDLVLFSMGYGSECP